MSSLAVKKEKETKFMNLGLEIFYDSLIEQGAQVVEVEFSRKRKIEKSLKEALDRLI